MKCKHRNVSTTAATKILRLSPHKRGIRTLPRQFCFVRLTATPRKEKRRLYPSRRGSGYLLSFFFVPLRQLCAHLIRLQRVDDVLVLGIVQTQRVGHHLKSASRRNHRAIISDHVSRTPQGHQPFKRISDHRSLGQTGWLPSDYLES